MNGTMSTIEKLIKEHSEIKDAVQACELAVSDWEQANKLDDVKESLVPGRLEDHSKIVARLERELSKIDMSITQHFYCEEESLLNALKSNRLPKLASVLTKLVAEHEEIRKQLAHLIKQASELGSAQHSLNIWHDKAWRLRKEILLLGESIREHADKEDALFREAKKALQAKGA